MTGCKASVLCLMCLISPPFFYLRLQQIAKLRQQLQRGKQGARHSRDRDQLSPLQYSTIAYSPLTSTTHHISTVSHIQVSHWLHLRLRPSIRTIRTVYQDYTSVLQIH